MRDTSFGSFAWGHSSCGVLRPLERIKMVRNLAFAQIRELSDLVSTSVGRRQVQPVELGQLLPRETSLVADSLALAEQTHSEPLLFHSWRTYFMGRLIAFHEGVDHDSEVFFASAILHDIALTDTHTTPVSSCCFAVSGGGRAQAHISAKGHGEDIAARVGDAISAHLNVYLSRRQSAAESYLLSRGATCDLFGMGRRRIAQDSLKELFEEYPRDGVVEALRFETADHLIGTRADFLTKISGGKAPKTPFFDRLAG